MNIDKLSEKEIAYLLQTEADACCDDDMATLLNKAANMLCGTKCVVKDCKRDRDVGSFCRPCYQAIRRKSHQIFDAQNRPESGDS